MTADFENHDNESFAEMFESYSQQLSASVEVGDKIQGKVISIGQDAVFVETGTKIDGVADRSEFVDDAGEISIAQGDLVELYVVAATENEIRLSKAMSGDGGLSAIQEAYRNRVPVEGQVKEVCKGGLVVEVMKQRAFCPISQIDLKYVEDPEPYLNQTFPFLISKLEDKGRNIVVTRRQILKEEQQKAEAAFLQNLSEGDIIDGMVTRLKPYGAFVELVPGLEGMVHISEIGWSRIEKPDDVLNAGDPIRVRVLSISQEGQKQGPRIALSVKQTSQDPWETATERFQIGETVQGRVTRCTAFGAFVEIAPGIEGLAHISELSYEKRVVKPEDVVKVGEALDVTVKEVDASRRRIALSVRDAAGDPWADVTEKFEIGKTYAGRVEKKEKFGYFVSLAPGITGLLPQSKLQLAERTQQRVQFKAGDSIEVVVADINPAARKMSLEPTGAADNENWRQYASSSKSMGDLGEKLKAALADRRKSE